MFKKHGKFFLCVMMALLAGCGLVPRRYLEPSTEPTAEITFDLDRNTHSSVQTYENPKDCSKRYLMKKVWDDLPVTRKIVANKEVSITISYANGTVFGCNSTFTFVPEARQRYRATSEIKEGGHFCLAKLEKNVGNATSNGDLAVPVVIEYREQTAMQMDEDSSYCRAH